jgi:hypothetical protein
MRIDAVVYASAGTSGQPTRYEIFIGKNKYWRVEGFGSTGRSGALDTDLFHDDAITKLIGLTTAYDPSTGVLFVDTQGQGSTITIRRVGKLQVTGGGAASAPTNGYFDIIVSENPLFVSSQAVRSEVSLYTGNGHGSSTGTCIRRFTNTLKNVGTAITYADSSTAGASFTINEDGIYALSWCDRSSVDNTSYGFSKNSNQLTTSIASITATHVLAAIGTPTSNHGASVSWTGFLAAGDVIRPHDDTGLNFTGDNLTRFTITKVVN